MRSHNITSSSLIFLATMAAITSPNSKIEEKSLMVGNNQPNYVYPPLVVNPTPITASDLMSFIHRHPGVNPEEATLVRDTVLKAQHLHPYIAECFNLVFKFAPGFKFEIVTPEQFIKTVYSNSFLNANNLELKAAFSAKKGKFYIPTGSDKNMIAYLLIGMRSAYWHTLHSLYGIQGNPKADSDLTLYEKSQKLFSQAHNYFTLQEKNTISALIQKGKDKLQDLKKLLEEEANGLVKKGSKAAKRLQRLRLLVTGTYDNYCKEMNTCVHTQVIDMPQDSSPEAISAMRFNMPGTPDNVLLNPFFHEKMGDKVKLYLRPVDPLWGIVTTMVKLDGLIKENYLPDALLYVYEGHLFQSVPVPVIEELFGDYLQFISSLTPTSPLFLDSINNVLEQPKLIQKCTEDEKLALIVRIRFLISSSNDHSKLKQCVAAAEELLHTNAFKRDALLLASSASFKMGDYESAANYGYRANKLSGPTQLKHDEENLQYEYALSSHRAGFYTRANKACRKVVRTSTDKQHKADCEGVLAEIKRLKVV